VGAVLHDGVMIPPCEEPAEPQHQDGGDEALDLHRRHGSRFPSNCRANRCSPAVVIIQRRDRLKPGGLAAIGRAAERRKSRTGQVRDGLPVLLSPGFERSRAPPCEPRLHRRSDPWEVPDSIRGAANSRGASLPRRTAARATCGHDLPSASRFPQVRPSCQPASAAIDLKAYAMCSGKKMKRQRAGPPLAAVTCGRTPACRVCRREAERQILASSGRFAPVSAVQTGGKVLRSDRSWAL
jgi:hypothetical protein